LAAVPVPRAAAGRIVLAVDVTCWLRSEVTHPARSGVLCHTYGRGNDTHIMVPGWAYSLVTALETGRSSWTAPLDIRRLLPAMTPPRSPPPGCVTLSRVRMRLDRVPRRRAPVEPAGLGRPPRHGGGFAFADPASRGDPDAATVTHTRLYGQATTLARQGLHPRLTHRTACLEHAGPLPILAKTPSSC
jgi:hypothetical protein